MQADAARNEADRLRREAQAEAHAAAAAAEAERNTRAEAEGTSEALRQDAERRARVFNNAVKAAVGRVQRELEGERDELQVCEGRDGRGGGAQGGRARMFNLAVEPAVGGQRELEGRPVDVCREAAGWRGGGVGARQCAGKE